MFVAFLSFFNFVMQRNKIVGSVATKNGGCAGFNSRDFAITKSSWKIY